MPESAFHRFPLAEKLASRMFTLTGSDVRTRWYSHYKQTEISRVLSGRFDASHLPSGYGLHLDERIVEYPWLFSCLPTAQGRLLDAGSVLNFEYVLRHPVLRNKELTIMTLAPESGCFWQQGISYVYGDLRATCFREDYFDWIACLSTLEHVGLDNTLFYTRDSRKQEDEQTSYVEAVRELHRVLKPGGACFVSLPFGVAETRPWLQVFDGTMVDNLVCEFQPSTHSEWYFRYSAQNGWEASSRDDAKDARYFDSHFDTPWDGCPTAAEAVVCLELRK
ncbi:MAG: class I SAM-dependent methyltransferase [Terriglobales bacterium]